MDIVYTSLERHPTADRATAAEAAEAVDALWAHAVPADGVEHITATAGPQRLDLLLYLLTTDPTRSDTASASASASERCAAFLSRSHHASPLLRHRYQPPTPQTRDTRTRTDRPTD